MLDSATYTRSNHVKIFSFFWIDLSCRASLTDLKVGYLKSQRRKLKKKKPKQKNLNTNTTVTDFK